MSLSRDLGDLIQRADDLGQRDPVRAGQILRDAQVFLLTDLGTQQAYPLYWLLHIRGEGKTFYDQKTSGPDLRPFSRELGALGYSEREPDGSPLFGVASDTIRQTCRQLGQDDLRMNIKRVFADWISLAERSTRKPISYAFDLFDAQGMPARFEPSTKYDVLHPETGAPYPPKAIWHLHCGEAPGFAMNQSLRDRMQRAGFTVVLKSDSAQVALSPAEFAASRPGDATYTEGAERQITRNIRERDPNARAACIAHYRAIHGGRLPCVVCDLDFGEAYGELGSGYIHVHHLDPLSESQGARSVSPTTDLVPVCPNCHAMIHLGGQTRSIAEVRDILRKTT